jgi:hypothetical protein
MHDEGFSFLTSGPDTPANFCSFAPTLCAVQQPKDRAI